MAKRRTVKRSKALRRSKRRSNGGGYGDGPDSVAAGYLVHHPYTGPGKDCTGNPDSIRPGFIAGYSPKGLPGFAGGARRKNRKHKKYNGGAYPVTNPNLAPVSGSVTPKPDYFPDTTGAGGTVGKPVVMSMPGVPTPGAAQMPLVKLDSSASPANLAAPVANGQKGGRYGFFPSMGPLNPVNGVGVSPAPFGRIPCETGTYNPLNPNPNGVQTMSTAPASPPYVKMAGGASSLASTAASFFPTVQVGDADSMRYYAPNAGYRNDFMTFRAPSPVPGLTIQTPYAASAFNQACIKTGGSRKTWKKGGAQPVALNAGTFTPVTINEVGNRFDFDGTTKGLPVKFGGGKKTHRRAKKHKKSRKGKKN
jgi:hypothetical protein